MTGPDRSTIDSAVEKIAARLPSDLRELRGEFENNTRGIILAMLDRLDLVTREEFETQKAVLMRTREKLDALEKQLQEFEDN
jgi:hypothetical protein